MAAKLYCAWLPIDFSLTRMSPAPESHPEPSDDFALSNRETTMQSFHLRAINATQSDHVEILIGEEGNRRIVTRFGQKAPQWSQATVSRSAAHLISHGAVATPAAHSE